MDIILFVLGAILVWLHARVKQAKQVDDLENK